MVKKISENDSRLLDVETIFYVDWINQVRAEQGLPEVILGPSAHHLRSFVQAREATNREKTRLANKALASAKSPKVKLTIKPLSE